MPSFLLRTTIIALSLLTLLSGQTPDSLTAAHDSLAFGADSLMRVKKERRPPVRLSPKFFNNAGTLRDSLINEPSAVYQFSDILQKNYTDPADIMLNEAAFQVFDLNEPFRPSYTAPLNMLPHQSALSLDYHRYSSPISGLYSTRYLPLDGVNDIETSPLISSDGSSAPQQINTRLVRGKKPYTRIMFSQGDWGFSNVDITFSEQFTNRLLVQLGGARQQYDGWQYNVSSINDNYRAQVAYQINDNIYNRFRFQKNDGMFGMFNFSAFPDYRLSDERVDIYDDLVIAADNSSGSYWRVSFGVNTASRTAYFDTFRVVSKFDNYTAGVTRLLTLGPLEMQGAVNLSNSQVWGSGFADRYPDNTLQGAFSLTYSFLNHFYVKPSLDYRYIFNFKGALSASAVLGWQKDNMNALLSYEKFERLAYRNERSFRLFNYSGKEDIQNENTRSLTAAFSWNAGRYLLLKASAGRRTLQNEIIFDGSAFHNGEQTAFNYIAAKAQTAFYKFVFLGGGQLSTGDINISPQSSAWIQGRYHSKFYHDRITFDAIGSAYFYGSHRRVLYDPVIDRFYYNAGITDEGYWFFNYKLAVTIKDIQFYFAMDNPLSSDYAYVYGYMEQFRRIVFGLNWVLWD